MKRILIIILILLFTQACASVIKNLPDFQDGTWSNCTFVKDGKLRGPFPFQIPPGLQVPNISDAVDIKCTPIPAVVPPVLAPS